MNINYQYFSIGIVKRFEAGSSTGDEQVRLKKLSSIQARLVEHAATFPSVERIVRLYFHNSI